MQRISSPKKWRLPSSRSFFKKSKVFKPFSRALQEPEPILVTPQIAKLSFKEKFKNIRLFDEWRQTLFTKKYIAKDIISGVNVASIVLPLSLAIAVASGVPPQVALVSSIIGGIICSLFGGSTLSVSGPAAALAIVVCNIVMQEGLAGLFVVTAIAGALQILTGFLKWGKFTRMLPSPIIHGFINGIGAIIFVKQLPKAFGINMSNEGASIVQVLTELAHKLPTEFSLVPLGLTFLTLGTIFALKKVPWDWLKNMAPLIGVGTCGIVNYVKQLGSPIIGSIPSSLPAPQWIGIAIEQLPELMGYGALVFVLCSLESLLSCTAVDQLTFKREKQAAVREEWLKYRHDPNQELIGQGMANMIVPFFSGMPVTSVVVRSSVNVKSGAMTRRAGIAHSVALLVCMATMAPVMAHLPFAALAGVLIQVSIGMMDPKTFMHVWNANRSEIIPYLTVAIGMCFVGMVEGVGLALAVHLAILLLRRGRKLFDIINIEISNPAEQVFTIKLNGPVNFLAVPKLAKLKENLRLHAKYDTTFNFDFSNVDEMDITGTEKLVGVFDLLGDHGCKVVVLGIHEKFIHILEHCTPSEMILHFKDVIYEEELQVEKPILQVEPNKNQ